MYVVRQVRGFGQTTSEIMAAGSAGSQIASAAASSEPVSTQIESSVGAGLLAAAPFTGPAAPFVAVAGLAAEFLAKFGVGSGCGPTCALSTAYANKAESILQQNIATYFNLPTPRAATAQQAALTVFDSIWTDLEAQCGGGSLAGTTAGQKCITDRQEGGCTWKQPASSVPPWGTPPAGACWNWFNGYRDPIANDPNVVDDVTAAATSASSAVASVTGNTSLLGLLALAAGLFLVFKLAS